MSEQEVISVIEKTVNYLAPSFKFGYFDADDMRQEGTIFCMEALDNFNFNKSSKQDRSEALFTFLKTHVRWRFLNMRRKQLMRCEPPACDCPLCKEDSANRLDCPKYSNWIRRNISKKSLMEPFDVEEVYGSTASYSQNVEDKALSSEIIKVLNERVPVDIRADYRKFIDGVSIPKERKKKLILKIKDILKEYYDEERKTE